MRAQSTVVARRGGLWVALGLIAGAPAAHAQETDVALGVSSAAVLRGIVLGRREPSWQASTTHYAANGLYAGLSAATLRFSGEPNRAVQIAARLGLLRPLDGDWQANVAIQHVGYPFDASWSGFRYDEATVGVAYADVAVATLSVLRHADDYTLPSRSSIACDVVGRVAVRPGIALSGGLGYHGLQRRSSFGYAYGHAGLGVRLGRATADLAYTVTDATAKAQFGANAANRWTASLLWHF